MLSPLADSPLPSGKTMRLASLFLVMASTFFAGTPKAQAEPLAFIEHVRVGLHQKTVRIVLTLDRRPPAPAVKKQTTARPEIRLPGVMPGATVHRRLLVRNPSFLGVGRDEPPGAFAGRG